jgi:hypothetical protein
VFHLIFSLSLTLLRRLRLNSFGSGDRAEKPGAQKWGKKPWLLSEAEPTTIP